MSRNSYRNDYFPPIKTVYEDSYGSARGSPQPLVAYRRSDFNNPSERLVELENRLETQERTTQQLVDKAISIKQDLIENLSLNQGTWQEEKGARELLQEHVRTITSVIRQLNKDIKNLEGQIKDKESTLNDTGNVVRQIENSQLSSVGELRNRIGRCDAGIAKLAADLKQTNEGIRLVGGDVHDHNQKVQDKIQSIEIKNQDLQGKIDKLSSESNSNIRQSVDEALRKVVDLEHRTKSILEDIRHQVTLVHSQGLAEREKLETRLLAHVDKINSAQDSRLDMLENTVNSDKHHSVILERLDNVESEFKKFQKEKVFFEKELERKLSNHSDRLYRQQQDDMVRFKREIRDGFAAIHETINNMKSVVEGKQKLSEENLRKEMAQLRKMVVLI